MFNYSYWHHYTRDERAKLAGDKISFSQKRKNSNAKNAGIPRCLLDKQVLEELILKDYTVFSIAKHLKVAPQTVEANINYYGIDLPINGKHVHFLSNATILNLKKLDSVFGTDLVGMHSTLGERNPVEIHNTLLLLDDHLLSLRDTLKHVTKNNYSYAKDKGIDLPNSRPAGSRLNFRFGAAFSELGYICIFEHRIEDKYYDILLEGTNILIEIDPQIYHNTESSRLNDQHKDNLAKKYNFVVYRITSPAEKLSTIRKQVNQCLQNLKSKGLLQ
jgi:hypothetical protein